jgi:hypothetical protein
LAQSDAVREKIENLVRRLIIEIITLETTGTHSELLTHRTNVTHVRLADTPQCSFFFNNFQREHCPSYVELDEVVDLISETIEKVEVGSRVLSMTVMRHQKSCNDIVIY